MVLKLSYMWESPTVVVQSLNHVRLFATLWTAACQSPLSSTISWCLLRFMSIESIILSNHRILCHSLLLLLTIFPQHQVFSNKLALSIEWPKYCNFSFSISPSNEYSGWFPLELTGLISLKSKGLSRVFSSITIQKHQFFDSAFFMVKLSDPNMATGRTIAWTIWSFVGKVMSLLFNMLSRLVIAIFPSRKCLHFMAAVTICKDFRAQENKICHCLHFSPSIWHEVMGLDAMILVFWKLSFRPAFLLSSFTLIKRLFSSTIKVVSSTYLGLLIFLWAILIPAYDSSNLAFCMIYSAYKLNKQGDNIQPWLTPSPILNQSVISCLVLLLLDPYTGFSGDR